MKLFRKTFPLALAFAAIFVSSCSSDNTNTPGPSPATSHKVLFKAQVSAGSNIEQAVYGYDSDLTTATSLSGTTWQSPELTAPAGTVNAGITIDGVGADANATIKVQIYIDGVLKKEGTGSGSALVATAQYSF